VESGIGFGSVLVRDPCQADADWGGCRVRAVVFMLVGFGSVDVWVSVWLGSV
jgi:hypothetical protein